MKESRNLKSNDDIIIMENNMKSVINDKRNKLFFILGAFFLSNAFIAEFIGVKLFSLEDTFGLSPFGLNPGGEGPLNFTAGVLLWPVVFILTDIINEYFGVKGVKFLSYMAAILIGYAFIMVYWAIHLFPASFWIESYKDQGIDNMQNAFAAVFGQGLWIIIGSLVAFLIGQIIDALVFRKIKSYLGSNKIWLRATVSTMVSQLIDSYVVLYIAFYIGGNWTIDMLFSIGTVNYIYKIIMAILFIPLLYFIHLLIDNYLGKELSQGLKELSSQS